jgi:hypothetical protein
MYQKALSILAIQWLKKPMGLDAICRFGCLNPGFACGIDGFKMAIQSVAPQCFECRPAISTLVPPLKC